MNEEKITNAPRSITEWQRGWSTITTHEVANACPNCTSKQKEIDELVEAMQEVLRISDRKHDAWDKVYMLIEKGKSK